MNYLHVGYPKCGSSFLQNAYFTQENGFCNLLIHAPHEFRDFITHDLLISDSMSYSGNMPAITEHSVFKKNIGLSAEDFITAPVDYSLLLDRWTELFPTSKVLIVIRSQPDLIYSWYVQLINAGTSEIFISLLANLCGIVNVVFGADSTMTVSQD